MKVEEEDDDGDEEIWNSNSCIGFGGEIREKEVISMSMYSSSSAMSTFEAIFGIYITNMCLCVLKFMGYSGFISWRNDGEKCSDTLLGLCSVCTGPINCIQLINQFM